MKKNSILFIHLLNDRSGSPKVLSEIIEIANSLEYETHLITTHTDGFLNGKADKQINLPYFRSKNRYITLINYICSQVYLFIICLRDYRSNFIYYVNTMLPFGAAIAGKLTRKKIIFHIHETNIQPKLLKLILRTVISHTADKVVFVSNFLRKKEAFEQLEQRVIYNSVNAAEFVGRVHYNDQPFNVLMLASLRKFKGILEFIDLANYCILHPNITFSLVLNASDFEISDYFKNIKIPDNVKIYPRQANTAIFYRAAQLVVNLSRPNECIETFGLTLVEAMASGIPVIAPPLGGPTEIVSHGKNGYLISCYSTEEIAAIIVELSKNETKYTMLAENALIKSHDFNSATFKKEVNQLLNSIMIN